MAEISRPDTDGHVTLTATSARQGRYGKHMVWVLVFGALLAAAGLFLAWTWKAPDLSRDDAKLAASHAAAGAAFDAPNPAPSTRQKP